MVSANQRILLNNPNNLSRIQGTCQTSSAFKDLLGSELLSKRRPSAQFTHKHHKSRDIHLMKDYISQYEIVRTKSKLEQQMDHNSYKQAPRLSSQRH